MKTLALLLSLSLTIIRAEEPVVDIDMGLKAENFEAREEAEQELIKWAGEGEGEERIDLLVARCIDAEEPEERFRLEKILFQLKRDTIVQQGEGFVGISMNTRFPETRGVIVTEVIEGTPAERVGLLAQDLILEIDGQGIGGASPTENLIAIVKGKPPGTAIKLTVERGEERLQLDVPLMNRAALKQRNAWDPASAEVDLEKAEQLLREDFRRWFRKKRDSLERGQS